MSPNKVTFFHFCQELSPPDSKHQPLREGASIFNRTFYISLFMRKNVGLAFLGAREYVTRELGEMGDLIGYRAMLFGDAVSKRCRDLAMAV